MSFEWLPFLDAHHIFYATSGSNVSRGNVAVHCPFCGPADQSQHMSIAINGRGWHCFRQPEHSGKSPVYLVQALLGTTLDRARAIVGDSLFIPDGDFMQAVMSKFEPPSVDAPRKLTLPEDFKPIVELPSTRRAIDYLTGPSRQFTRKQALTMTGNYDLRFATRGHFKGRIIFPVRYKRKLVTWTGRSIYPSEQLRYRTLSTDAELTDTPALGPISDYLLFYDALVNNVDNSDTLILCEGPFDALKVRVIGRKYGIRATCFFTAAPSARQIDMLYDVLPFYRHRYLLLDRGTLSTTMRVWSELRSAKIEPLKLPDGVKDPGLLTRKQLLQILP